MIARDNEEKRNRLWKIVMSVTTALIIIIAGFFVIKLFTANPLEGKWAHEDSDMYITIKGNGTATLQWLEEFEPQKVVVAMRYDIDRDMKTFTFQADVSAIRKAAESAGDIVTEETLASAVNAVEGTYDYSIEQRKLTLTDREYGDQMIFDKK